MLGCVWLSSDELPNNKINNFSTERLLVVAKKYIAMLLREFSKIAKAYCVLI